MALPAELKLLALKDFPMVKPGDDLATLIEVSLRNNGIDLIKGDIIVLAQKIVSKAENRQVKLADVTPSERAKELAISTDKDPRLVELILQESNEVVRTRGPILIVEQKLGFVMANAGIDQSNISHGTGNDNALLLPENPDASARSLRDTLQEKYGCDFAVIINDSVGRAWRNGTVGLAIGTSGIDPLWDRRGDKDLFDRTLEITEVGLADEISAAASLLMGQGDEGTPVVIVRGVDYRTSEDGIGAALRPKEFDLFR